MEKWIATRGLTCAKNGGEWEASLGLEPAPPLPHEANSANSSMIPGWAGGFREVFAEGA